MPSRCTQRRCETMLLLMSATKSTQLRSFVPRDNCHLGQTLEENFSYLCVFDNLFSQQVFSHSGYSLPSLYLLSWTTAILVESKLRTAPAYWKPSTVSTYCDIDPMAGSKPIFLFPSGAMIDPECSCAEWTIQRDQLLLFEGYVDTSRKDIFLCSLKST